VLVIFPPSARRKPVHLLTSSILEPLAITLRKDHFEFSDLVSRSTEFVLKYQSKRTKAWENYQKSIEALTKNAQVYLGDFLLFALVWVVLFRVPSLSPWTKTNQPHFWSVFLTLLAFGWFAWFRVSRAVAAVPSLLLIYVSVMLRSDSDVAPLLDIPEEHRSRLRRNLEKIIEKEKETMERRPALRRFIGHRLGLREHKADHKRGTISPGLPFPALYARGLRFARDPRQNEHYENRWLSGYLAFLYYRFHRRFSTLVRTFSQLIRYVITGAP
jgi:hypothetical protein